MHQIDSKCMLSSSHSCVCTRTKKKKSSDRDKFCSRAFVSCITERKPLGSSCSVSQKFRLISYCWVRSNVAFLSSNEWNFVAQQLARDMCLQVGGGFYAIVETHPSKFIVGEPTVVTRRTCWPWWWPSLEMSHGRKWIQVFQGETTELDIYISAERRGVGGALLDNVHGV